MPAAGFLSIGLISHRAALVGRVIDQLTQQPLPAVEVSITDAPAEFKARLAALRHGRPELEPERRTTGDDGSFRWINLPAGAYKLTAATSGKKYATAAATVNVSLGQPAIAEMDLAPTAVTGFVKANSPAGPLAMARVRFVDSGELAYTGADGSFTLSAVEPGTNRTLEFSARRYVTATQAVTLQQGQIVNANPITLNHS
jgi:hypothetical protein